MGVYIFDTEILVKNVIADAKDTASAHDFGKNVVPAMIDTNRVFVHNFRDPTSGSNYWRDIGTIDAYWEANMDLCSVQPQCDLYDARWPIRTYQPQVPPARTVSTPKTQDHEPSMGLVQNSVISGGCVVGGAKIVRSVLSPLVNLSADCIVEDSVLLDGVHVGENARIRKALIDRHVSVPAGFSIGYDRQEDLKRFSVSSEGVVIVPQGIVLD
jgi:glucose-1-phosphate adenylyltransferase